MKVESLKMNLKSLKSRVNNEKGWLIKGKITKSSVTFCKNKPNSPIVQINLTSFTVKTYAIFARLTIVKNKPNQSQYKANYQKAKNEPKSIYDNELRKFSSLPMRKNKPNSNPTGAKRKY